MPRSVPPLTWFRAFEAAARRLSFTAAAEELHLTQSAISQQVRSLELRLGVTLFQRKPRGLALTDDGRQLLPEVSGALGTLADVARRYEPSTGEAQLTIAASVSIIQYLLSPIMGRLRQSLNGVNLRLISTVWPDDFRSTDTDIEIRFGAEHLVGDNATRLQPDELIVVASPQLQADPQELQAKPLIETVGTTDGWSQWRELSRYQDNLEPSLVVDYHGAALSLALQGSGIALTSSLISKPYLDSGELLQVRPETLNSRDGYFLALRNPDDKLSQRFAQWLLDYLLSQSKA